MAPEPDLRRRPSEGVPGTLGFTLRLRWGLTAPSLPWLFASSRTKSVEAMVKRTEKINEKLSCHRDYCIHFHGTFSGQAAVSRETGRLGREMRFFSKLSFLVSRARRNPPPQTSRLTGMNEDDVEGGKERWRPLFPWGPPTPDGGPGGQPP